MKFTPATNLVLALCGSVIPFTVQAKVYSTVEQAQQAMFPGQTLVHRPFLPTPAQQQQLRDISSVSHPFQGNRIWKTANGGWFVIDEVVGKHEMITYAVGIGPDGKIVQIAVLEYHESYGYEVAEASWRSQFIGKTAAAPIKLEKDIQNIGGATLSCKHITDGVRRVMSFYEMVLKSSPA